MSNSDSSSSSSPSSSLYVIFDRVAESVTGPLMTFPSDAVARRTFQDAITASGSVLGQHPEDYSLHRVGSFYPDTGFCLGVKDGVHAPGSEIISGSVIVDMLNRQQETLSNG